MLLGKIDEYGKVGWITVVVIGFWLAWPIGLMLLAFLYGSGRLNTLGAGKSGPGAWFNLGAEAGKGRGPWGRARTPSSGNKAFDDYRSDTLRRLEDEEREFQAFIERLRHARDKSEFDSFMAERRSRSTSLDEVGGDSV